MKLVSALYFIEVILTPTYAFENCLLLVVHNVFDIKASKSKI